MKRLLLLGPLVFLAVGCESIDTNQWTAYQSTSLQRVVEAPFEKMAENANPIDREVGRIHFAYDKANLNAEAKHELDRIALQLKRRAGAVVIEGHADHNNSDEYNTRLGYQRAITAAHYLRSAGVWEERLVVRSFGEGRPSASNWSEDGQMANRIVIVKTYAQGEGMAGDEAERAYKLMRAIPEEEQSSPSMMESLLSSESGS
ncbi:MAG: OmpA family protein [Candidatus Hinthialibacter antarcticus]|nr:OmpA family protein [Candidatus Hinthialibacter antarcticus]